MDKNWSAWKDNKSICPLQLLMEFKLKPRTFYLNGDKAMMAGWKFSVTTAAEKRSPTNTAAADKKSCKGIRVCSDDNNIFVCFLLPTVIHTDSRLKIYWFEGFCISFFWNHCRRKLHQINKKKKKQEKKHIAFSITYEDCDIFSDKQLHLKPRVSQNPNNCKLLQQIIKQIKTSGFPKW